MKNIAYGILGILFLIFVFGTMFYCIRFMFTPSYLVPFICRGK